MGNSVLTRWHVPEHVVARQVDVVDDLAEVGLEIWAGQVHEVVQGLLGNVPLPLQFSCRVEAVTYSNRITCTGWHISWWNSVRLTLIWDVSPSCPAAQPALPISHQPRQNQAEGGTAKILVNPTEVRQEMCHPVSLSIINPIRELFAYLYSLNWWVNT